MKGVLVFYMATILIANGPIVLEKPMGPLIDSFDTVVRFNNFELAGFEDKVGSKVSILARRCCDDVNLFPADKLDKVLVTMTYCQHSQFMWPVARDLYDFYEHKLEVIPVSMCKEYGDLLKLDHPLNEWATVGILTIIHLLKTTDKLHLYGFDYSVVGKHYFKRQPKDSKFHSWKKEADYVNQLEKEGRIVHVTN